jgi:hypothetical protein
MQYKIQSPLALIMIDTEINIGWFEIVESISKAAASIQDLFHNTCLA